MTSSRSHAWFDRANTLMPGGVNSPVRAFKGVGGKPRFISSADGCFLTDVDGHRYVDYIGSWGPMIVGHAAPAVVAAIEAAASQGTSFGAPSPAEVELAEEITRRVPSVDKIRMVNSGTEAVMSAVRLARAATSRSRIIKFAGCYHGHADALLVRAGSGAATLGLPDSPGVPAEAAGLTLTARYNDLDSVRAILQAVGEDVAAVVVEPVAGNMGVVPPAPGFLSGLRSLTREFGALLVFDEVMTGFRVSPGGAQTLFDIEPDLTTFGKIIGGGLPVGAYGGTEALMDLVAPAGPVYQAGTLSGNPLAMAAGLATLKLLNDAAYVTLEQAGDQLEQGLVGILQDAGASGRVQRVGSMMTLFFSVDGVADFEHAAAADHDQFAAFFHAMLERGVHLPPSGYEAWFLSLSHTPEIISSTLDIAREAMAVTCRL